MVNVYHFVDICQQSHVPKINYHFVAVILLTAIVPQSMFISVNSPHDNQTDAISELRETVQNPVSIEPSLFFS